MKIDIHCHTKKTKEGDSEKRNITAERLEQIIRSTDVGILSISNHNHFDLDQYKKIATKIQDFCQVWPGIELDIVEDGRRAHLIVIVNPNDVDLFSQKVVDLTTGKTADTFTISIDETVKGFDSFQPIYVAHYHGKKPNLFDEDLEKLYDQISNKKRILKEASNSISAGIYISHGQNSIYGSDVQDWDEYINLSKDLPELRLPVESFEQFCLLLEKDTATINTILSKKTKESIQINPFGVAELINIDIYNDINIIFGSKGTGKTEILKAISKYYNDLGYKNSVYESNLKKLDDAYDLKGTYFDANVEDFNIENCAEEIREIKNSSEKNITGLTSYTRYFSVAETNKIAKNLKIKNFPKIDESSNEREFEDAINAFDKLNKFNEFIFEDKTFQNIIGNQLFVELSKILREIIDKLQNESQERFINLRTISLYNQIIEVFVQEIAKKTGQPQKPLTTGFAEYSKNRLKIEKNLNKILFNISKRINPKIVYVGDLGGKGKLFCQTNLYLQNGNLSNSNYSPVKNVTKNPQKNVANKFAQIAKHLYANSLFEKITELNDIDGVENINNLSDFLLFYRHFSLEGNSYTPSSGESSMVLLHNELLEEKDIFIIDEPEKSLGNDYISDVIVPLLKAHAKSGKKVIIATHDANIAVRTLPYNSIYRKHDIDGYFTFSGNPFTNDLICINGNKPKIDWKEISMKTLEGGKGAFGERKKIYGNT